MRQMLQVRVHPVQAHLHHLQILVLQEQKMLHLQLHPQLQILPTLVLLQVAQHIVMTWQLVKMLKQMEIMLLH